MKSAIILFSVLLCGSIHLYSQNDTDKRKKQFNLDESGIALSGYDAISYFTGEPKKGNASFSYTYNGVKYLFVSETNLSLFKKAPAKFEPAYGGWCAYAMGASGEKVDVDPKTYKLLDGRLYLFYNTWVNNTLPKWNKNETDLKTRADKNWAGFCK